MQLVPLQQGERHPALAGGDHGVREHVVWEWFCFVLICFVFCCTRAQPEARDHVR
jgi:hypothetical protein